MEAFVKTTIENHIATITFFHPASNSFPAAQLKALEEQIVALNENSEVNVVVLKSEGDRAFCAGASFDELLQVDDQEEGLEFFSGFARVINAMRKSPKVFIARVQGKTVGGGVGLVAACDYAIAHENASIKLSELSIGIGPFVIEPAVSKKIGKTAMSTLTLEATQWKSAQWALEHQLYQKVFSTMEALDAEVMTFAKQLASYNPAALEEMKRIFWDDTDNWDSMLMYRAKISGSLVLSEFTKNALEQFKNK